MKAIFVALTLLVAEALAAHHGLAARHQHNPLAARNPERRLNRRGSCKPPSSSSSSSSSSAAHSTTVSSKKAESTSKSSDKDDDNDNDSGSKSSSSNSGSGSGSKSSSGGSGQKINSVQAAAGYTPKGIKAGTSSGNALSTLNGHIGWWYDWTPQPYKSGIDATAVPMLWGGGGSGDSSDSSRLAQFKKITQAPQYLLGFEEPDCAAGGGSAGMSVSEGVQIWEQYIAPFKAKGTKLGSPSMCKQAAETWLKSFSQQIDTPWDFTNIHINKNNMDGVRADLDHYAQYGHPIWISEFACVNDQDGFVPCTDQDEIDNYIRDIVDLFESDSRVAAYAYSNGEGLGNVWPMTTGSGSLSASGKTYLAAISKYN